MVDGAVVVEGSQVAGGGTCPILREVFTMIPRRSSVLVIVIFQSSGLSWMVEIIDSALWKKDLLEYFPQQRLRSQLLFENGTGPGRTYTSEYIEMCQILQLYTKSVEIRSGTVEWHSGN